MNASIEPGAGAVDAAIARGLDLDGSPIAPAKPDLYRQIVALEGQRQRSGVGNTMRSRIVRIDAKHLPQGELERKLIAVGFAGLKERKKNRFYYGKLGR
jgi:hypothetical protein